MSKQLDLILDNLKEAEGGKLHRNSKELNITNAYGIYRHFHPKAKIWEYIDKVALNVTRAPSDKWDDNMINKINLLIDPVIERELSKELYSLYFKRLPMDLINIDTILVIANCFTNTQTGTLEAIQEGLNDCYKYGLFKFTPTKPRKDNNVLTVDGDFGTESKRALEAFMSVSDRKDRLIFRSCMLLWMKSNYIKLAVNNQTGMLPNLRGWDNRMESAQHI